MRMWVWVWLIEVYAQWRALVSPVLHCRVHILRSSVGSKVAECRPVVANVRLSLLWRTWTRISLRHPPIPTRFLCSCCHFIQENIVIVTHKDSGNFLSYHFQFLTQDIRYTGCNRRKGPDFGRLFLMLNYTEKPQNTYIQSWTVSEIMASEVWNFDSYYSIF